MDMKIIDAAMDYITELFRGDPGGHDAAHSLRVYKNALLIAQEEPPCDLLVVSLAALLHDADDHKLFETKDNEHARAFLSAHHVTKTEEIVTAINAVSFSRNGDKRPDTPEGRIVQDADRLDAIGAVGIARTFAYGGAHGRGLEESIDHFYDKLLLLKDRLNTPTARRLAGERHEYMLAFLREYKKETLINDGKGDAE